jgi:hypothetical protein
MLRWFPKPSKGISGKQRMNSSILKVGKQDSDKKWKDIK